MKHSILLFHLFLIFTFLFIPSNIIPQENNGSQLTIPWEEFKNLINPDDDEIIISFDTFQKLLAQTGANTTPQHKLANGNVIVKREEFNKLVDRMKPPDITGTKPPFDYLITKAVYTGKMNKGSTDFKASFTVHVLKDGLYIKIPILSQSIALSDIRVNRKPALVTGENGYHTVLLSGESEYIISADFSIKSSFEKGPHKVDFAIQRIPITLFSLEVPLKDIDFDIPAAQQMQITSKGNSTIVSAVISQQSAINVIWRKKIEAAKKIPPKLYSEISHLISIDDDALKINSDINYNILHSEVDQVQFIIPDNLNVLNVTGNGVGEWFESVKDDLKIITVPFTYGKKGNVTIRVSAETALTESGLANLFSGFKTVGTVREIGFIGVALNTSAEVLVKENNGLEQISIQKLPSQLVNKSAKPLILGFKYLKHPYSIMLDIKKHEKIGVPVAAINSASVVTLFTEDGKIVHRLVYQVRNSSKQFLQITLPEKADVWSVFVGGQPVESSINGDRQLLVPLIRSRSTNNRLDTFPVEVIYNMVNDGFSVFGNQGAELPEVDLLVSQLIWSVYLPNDYSYKYFASTLEKEEIIRGLNIFSSEGREYDEEAMNEIGSIRPQADMDVLKKVYKGKDYKSSFRNNKLKEEQQMSQLNAEMEFGGRMDALADEEASPSTYGGFSTGVLPIQIEVPTSGQVYRFAKSIIKPGDELSFSVVYTQLWVNSFAKWLIIIVLILGLYLNRKKLISPWIWIKEKSNTASGYYKKNEDTINKYLNSIFTPIVLLMLVMIFSSISFFLTIFLFALLLVSVINLIVNYSNKKKKAKIEERKITEETKE